MCIPPRRILATHLCHLDCEQGRSSCHTYLNRSDLTTRALTLEAYSNNKTATHAVQALEHYLRTPHTSKVRTTLIIATNAKLAHIIDTNTINNPALR
jgi:hypothetical protein